VVVSEDQRGRIDAVRTLKLRVASSQLLASRRTRLAYAHMPLTLVARFHYRLLVRLNKIIEDLKRMAAYIIDMATPLRVDGERLIGVLVVLTRSEPKTSKEVANEKLTTKHELRVAHVNPSEEHKLDNVKTVKEVLLQATR
jgi:hypothetical protein